MSSTPGPSGSVGDEQVADVPEPAGEAPPKAGRPGAGLQTVLLALYLLLAVAAGARSLYQLVAMPSEAPVAFSLSGLSALVYLGGTVLLRREDRRSLVAAAVLCSAELLGVVAVGTLSVVDRNAFPRSTVWSDYGSGYGGLPLVLPALALFWLRRYRLRSSR